MSAATPSAGEITRADMRRAIEDLVTIRPGPGLRLSLLCSLSSLAMLAATFWFVDDKPIFLALCVVNGFLYASVLSLTHDAIHHTLTGWRWFDEIMPRAFSYCVFWPHGVYAELHKLHHKMNGRDLRDPERPTATRQEYDAAGSLRRFHIRHQWALNLLVFGGIGMTVKHALAAWRLKDEFPQLKRAALVDMVGILTCLAMTLALIIPLGVFWEYVVYFLIMERIIGFYQQLRSQIEHYGLWVPGDHHLQTKLLNCRNIRTNKVMRRFFNGLNYHSVHHAYPAIPFYNLGKAHQRLSALYDGAGRPLIEDASYFKTAWRLARRPRFIDVPAS